MLTTHSQRWRDGRTVFVNGPAFDANSYRVEAISEREARAFVVDHHYSRSFPAARQCVGLLRNQAGQGAALVGVAVFSVPMNERVVPRYTGLPSANAGAELGRFVLLDDVPMPGESWFASRAFAVLRLHRPGLEAVVSYADPTPRFDAAGGMIKPGHVGSIYKALSGRYLGTASGRSLLFAPNGQVVSDRALSKIRSGDTGRAYAAAQLLAAGAREPAADETPAAWVSDLLSSGFLRKARSAPKHVYSWGLTRRARAAGRRIPAHTYPTVGDPTSADVTALPLFAGR